MSIVLDKIKHFPQAPGVYFFKDAFGKILYVGKATNLRSRVSSYFKGAETRTHIEAMMPHVFDVDFEKTDSVLEALILESNLIKKHQPKYNVQLKDDKSFSYFVITKEEFPKVLIVRKTDIKKISNLKPCLPAGRSQISNKLKTQNKKNSSELFGNWKLEIQNSKIFGPYISKKQMEIALKIVRKIFPFHSLRQQSEKGCLDFQIGMCPGPYAGAITKAEYAKNIRGIRMILEGKKKSLISKMEKEMEKLAKQEEFEKAAQLRNKIFALNHIRDIALMLREFEADEFTKKLNPNSLKPVRIEAYDISNISGQHAVGSMVVFENGKPNKNEYRKFKIKTIDGANDVGMMREVLLRRFKNDWPMPDLVLLDGGFGHLNMAEKILHQELGLAVNIVSVAKGPTRKNLKFQTCLPVGKVSNFKLNQEVKNVLNDKFLVKRIMDEAHRFAITFHRKIRGKNALK